MLRRTRYNFSFDTFGKYHRQLEAASLMTPQQRLVDINMLSYPSADHVLKKKQRVMILDTIRELGDVVVGGPLAASVWSLPRGSPTIDLYTTTPLDIKTLHDWPVNTTTVDINSPLIKTAVEIDKIRFVSREWMAVICMKSDDGYMQSAAFEILRCNRDLDKQWVADQLDEERRCEWMKRW